MKRTLKLHFKKLFAFYLFQTGLRKRVKSLKEQSAIIPIFDHDPSPQQFEKYIQWLLNRGFEFISLEQLMAVLDGRESLDISKIWFTLDDGWRNNMKLLPVLEKYQIPLTLFVSTYAIETGFFRDKLEQFYAKDLPVTYKVDMNKLFDIPNSERAKIDQPLYERAMNNLPREAITVDELKQLSGHPLISIGLHTHTHPVLSQCSIPEIDSEIATNRKKLIEFTGFGSSALAIPYGKYNDQTIESLFKSGIQYIVSSDHGIIDGKNTRKVLPRNGIAQASFYENCCRMLNFWYPNVEKINLFRKN